MYSTDPRPPRAHTRTALTPPPPPSPNPTRRSRGSSPTARSAPRRDLIAFWLFGMTNNFGYVIMLSGANDIMSRFDSNLGTGCVQAMTLDTALLPSSYR